MNGVCTKTLALCEMQPIVAAGIRALLSGRPELRLIREERTLLGGMDLVRKERPSVVLVDKAFGIHTILEWIADLKASGSETAVVVWASAFSESEALRLVQAGAKGILRKTVELPALLGCLMAAASGDTWMEDGLFRESPRGRPHPFSDLTPRERQVMELVQRGLKNGEVAAELGIRPGTVKIHLRHIFEKTGVRDRYGLVLSNLKAAGTQALPAA